MEAAMTHQTFAEEFSRKAKEASRTIALLPSSLKKNLLADIAAGLRSSNNEILDANARDLSAGKSAGLTSAFIDRLTLTPQRIDAIARSVEEIALLDDPVGRIEKMTTRPSGIRVGQMRVPVGVVMVIYESRPNVTIDIAALCIKSGNAAILRGGKESIHSNMALYSVVTKALEKNGLDKNIVQLVENTDRELLSALLKMDAYIDIVVPRGGHGLIRAVTEQSTIPVIKHDKGVCHTYIDISAKREMAEKVCINAKVKRPGVCNAMETLLIHEKYPYMRELCEALIGAGVELRGTDAVQKALPGKITPVTDEDWDTEYLDLILSVKTVADQAEAVRHIHAHGSGHSEAIITEDYSNAELFLREVDSAAVFVNASTYFHDGGQFGLGAEVGISTQKLHARGAMGIEGLTCLKFVVYGHGEIRE